MPMSLMARKNADHAHRKIFLKLVRPKARQEQSKRLMSGRNEAKKKEREMSEKDRFDEVFECLEQASYVFCNNVDGDADDGKRHTCPYATVDEDGFVSCRERSANGRICLHLHKVD